MRFLFTCVRDTFVPSHHRLARPDRLKPVTSRPLLFSFCPDYEPNGFLLWKFNGKTGEFLFFSQSGKKSKTGRSLEPPQCMITDYLGSRGVQEGGADGVCGAAVMADLFACGKYHHLTHICHAPASAATALL